MLQLTRGIVLKYYNYSESSIIAKIFTEEFGLQSYIIKGIHSKKSKTGLALFQPLTLIEFASNQKENKSIHHLTEPRVFFSYSHLYTDVTKRMLLIFLAELLYKSIKEESPDKALFDWLLKALTWLDLSDSKVTNYHLVFMIQYSRFLGFYPKTIKEGNVFFNLQEGQFCQYQPEHPQCIAGQLAAQLYELCNSTFETSGEVKINTAERRKLIDILIAYYLLHLPGFKELKSIDVLKSVLD